MILRARMRMRVTRDSEDGSGYDSIMHPQMMTLYVENLPYNKSFFHSIGPHPPYLTLNLYNFQYLRWLCFMDAGWYNYYNDTITQYPTQYLAHFFKAIGYNSRLSMASQWSFPRQQNKFEVLEFIPGVINSLFCFLKCIANEMVASAKTTSPAC